MKPSHAIVRAVECPVPWWASALVGMMFLGAVALKAISPASFFAAVRHLTFDVLSSGGVATSAALLVGFEVFLGVGLILAHRSSRVRWAAAAVLLTFTLMLGLMLVWPAPRGCGCFGEWLAGRPRLEGTLGIVRNVGMACLLLLVPRGQPEDDKPTMNATSTSQARGASGFTLIELLVTIAVIGVLITILVPALRSSRDQAVVARSLSLLRQFSVSLGSYAADERDQFPYLGTPGKPNGPAMARGANIRAYRIVPGGYFGAHTTFWVNVFDDRDLPPAKEYCYDPFLPDLPERVLASQVKLTANVAAAPEYFTDDAYKRVDLDEDPLLRSVRWTEVRDPARKGILLDTRPQLWQALDRGVLAVSVSRADGGAMVYRLPEPTNEPDPWVFASYSAQWLVLSTRDGMRGVDFR